MSSSPRSGSRPALPQPLIPFGLRFRGVGSVELAFEFLTRSGDHRRIGIRTGSFDPFQGRCGLFGERRPAPPVKPPAVSAGLRMATRISWLSMSVLRSQPAGTGTRSLGSWSVRLGTSESGADSFARLNRGPPARRRRLAQLQQPP